MKGISLFFCVLSCMLSSCVVDHSDTDEVLETHRKVVFSSSMTTKGFILTENELESMGVFAYSTADKNYEIGIPFIELMKNQQMSRTKAKSGIWNDWNYTPAKFWPENNTEKYTFFAYAPYATNQNGLSFETVAPGEVPVISYSVPLEAQNQPDLCVALPQSDLTNRNAQVNFSFKHVLSCISFFIEGAGAQIKGIAVTGVKTSGSLSLGLESEGHVGMPYDYMIRWRLNEAITPLDYTAGLEFDEGKDYLTTTAEAKNILREDGYLMMLPQTLTNDAKIILTLQDGSRKEFPLRMMTEKWQAGVRYQYKLKWVGESK